MTLTKPGRRAALVPDQPSQKKRNATMTHEEVSLAAFGMMLVVTLAAGWAAQVKRGRTGAGWGALTFVLAIPVAMFAASTIDSAGPIQAAQPEFRLMAYAMTLGAYGVIMAMVIWTLPDRRA